MPALRWSAPRADVSRLLAEPGARDRAQRVVCAGGTGLITPGR